MGILENYEEAHSAFRTGSIYSCDDETLLRYLSGLANQNNINTGTQHRDIIRGLTINNILLKRHIDHLERKSTNMQKWFMVFALISALGSLAAFI